MVRAMLQAFAQLVAIVLLVIIGVGVVLGFLATIVHAIGRMVGAW